MAGVIVSTLGYPPIFRFAAAMAGSSLALLIALYRTRAEPYNPANGLSSAASRNVMTCEGGTDPPLATCQEDTMNRRRSIAMVIGLCAALVTSSAWAERSLFVGRWRLNLAQSTLPPGEPVPKDLICDIARADTTHVQWSLTVLTAEGTPHVETFDTVANGELYPISSGTTASFRLTGDALQATFKGPAGQSDAQTCTVSADRKQMTCRGVLTEGDGRPVSYVDVYDRL